MHVMGIGGSVRPGSASMRAMERALRAAEEAGASTELWDLSAVPLPLYAPEKLLRESPGPVSGLVQAARASDGFIWGTPAYHGTLSGAVKNALDYLEFLAADEPPYLHGKVVGLISTASGEMAAVNAVNTMVHVAHALRATVVPLMAPITHAWDVFDERGEVRDPRWAERLDLLGRQVVETAARLRAGEGSQAVRKL